LVITPPFNISFKELLIRILYFCTESLRTRILDVNFRIKKEAALLSWNFNNRSQEQGARREFRIQFEPGNGSLLRGTA
jgi:hypothetical protein